jgi:hypothetical protein
MVRKGSPVRVRQRALEKPLETAAFLVPEGVDPASVRARGPHLGRVRSNCQVLARRFALDRPFALQGKWLNLGKQEGSGKETFCFKVLSCLARQMADLRQKTLNRFLAKPPALEGDLRASLERLDEARALLTVAGHGHEYSALATGLAVAYPSGLTRLLSAQPDAQVILLERASPALDRATREHGVGYLDLQGRGRLVGPGFVYVVPPLHSGARGADVGDDDDDHHGPGEPDRAGAIRVSPFAPKASRVVRALLSDPDKRWRLSELAHSCRMNPGNVHRVLGGLRERGLVEKDSEAYVVDDAGSMLEAWAEQGRRVGSGQRMAIPVRDDLRSNTEAVIEMLDGHAAVSGELAAELYAPLLPSSHAIVHCVEQTAWDQERFHAAASQRPLRPRGQIVLDLADEGVAEFGQDRSGLPLVAPQQLYVDLFRDRSRAREAAEHVRREVLGF